MNEINDNIVFYENKNKRTIKFKFKLYQDKKIKLNKYAKELRVKENDNDVETSFEQIDFDQKICLEDLKKAIKQTKSKVFKFNI